MDGISRIDTRDEMHKRLLTVITRNRIQARYLVC